MATGVPSKIFASCAGLSGLAIAIVSGLAAENPADVILFRALIAAVVCNFVGWVIGILCERVFAESLGRYQSQAVQAATTTQKPGSEPGRSGSV